MECIHCYLTAVPGSRYCALCIEEIVTEQRAFHDWAKENNDYWTVGPGAPSCLAYEKEKHERDLVTLYAEIQNIRETYQADNQRLEREVAELSDDNGTLWNLVTELTRRITEPTFPR